MKYKHCQCGAFVWLKNHSTSTNGAWLIREWWNKCYKCETVVVEKREVEL